MGELIKCTKYKCAKCKYRCRFGTAPSGKQTVYNFCCNYLEVMGSSRIFENGSMKYDPKLCDKFEIGQPLQGQIDWSRRTNMKDREGDEYNEMFYTSGGKLHVKYYRTNRGHKGADM